jgi:hypothetical protein
MRDIYGRDLLNGFTADAIADMQQPVRCTWCGDVYDLGTVTVTARYTDCSGWKAPCCGIIVDDRGETGWKARADYTRIDKRGSRR